MEDFLFHSASFMRNNLLKLRASEICVIEIRVMQGVSVFYNIKEPPSKYCTSVTIYVEFILILPNELN